MLQVKIYTAPDAYGGTGLFAAQDIPKGTVVSRYDPKFSRYFSVEAYSALTGKELVYIQKYTYPDYSPNDHPPTVGFILCLDDAKFSNHSDDPNTYIYPHDLDASIACRDIKRDEEITCNYHQFDPDNVIHKMGLITCKTFLLKGLKSEERKA